MKQELFKITTNFSRGLSLAASPLIDQNEVQAAENYTFEDKSATVRKGVRVYGSLPARVDVLRKLYKRDGTAFTVAIAGGSLYKSDTSGEFTSVNDNTYDGDIYHAVYDDVLYFTNYSSPIKFFDGTSVDDAGLSSPIFRKQIEDMENINVWNADVNGAVAEDNDWSHIDFGSKSILFSASNPATAAVFSATNAQTSNYINLQSISFATNSIVVGPVRDISGIMSACNLGGGVSLARSITNGSSWTITSTGFSDTPNGQMGSIAVDSSGNVTTFMKSTSGLPGSGRYEIFNWGAEGNQPTRQFVAIEPNNNTPDNSLYHCIDKSNIIHCVYIKTSSATKSPYHLWYSNNISSNTSTFLGPETLVAIGGSGQAITSPAIAVDGSAYVHVSWWGKIKTKHAAHFYTRTSSGAWIGTSTMLASGYGWDTATLRNKLAVDYSNNIIWAGEVTPVSSVNKVEEIFVRKFYAGSGTWGEPDQITTSSQVDNNYPTPIVYTSSQYAVVWKARKIQNGQIGIGYKKNDLSSWGGTQIIGTSAPNVTALYHLWPQDLTTSTSGYRPGVPQKGWAAVWDGGFRTSEDLLYEDETGPSGQNLNLTQFAQGVPSSGADAIEFFTTHRIKANISSVDLVFKDDAVATATCRVTSMSTWRACSNDNFGISHVVPKVAFSTVAGFQWASCHVEIHVTPTSNSIPLAQVTFDNIRLTKSPPVPATLISSKADTSGLFVVTQAMKNWHAWELYMIADSASKKGKKGFRKYLGAKNLLAGAPLEMNFIDREIQQKVLGRYIDKKQNAQWDWYNNLVMMEYFSRQEHENNRWETTPFPHGEYFYKQTFLKKGPNNKWIESNPSYQSSGITIPSNLSSHYAVRLTDMVTAPSDWNVVARNVYRRRRDGEYEQLALMINDNNTSSIIDWTPQQRLGATLEDNHWPPPNSKYLYMSKNNEMYYLNILEEGTQYPSRIRKSAAYEPYYAPLENTQDLAPNDGTEGTGIFEIEGVVYALKERSLWGENQTGIFQNIHPSIGCIAPKSIAIGDNEAYWLSEHGLVRFNGRVNLVGNSLDGTSINRLKAITERLPKDYIGKAVGHYYNGLYLLAVTDEGQTYNNLVICYDTRNDVLSTFPNLPGGVNCWDSWQGYKDGYRLFYGNYSGQVCELFTGNYDISTPIQSTLWTRSFGVPTPQASMRKAYLALENLDGEVKSIEVVPYFDLATASSYVDRKVLSGTTDLMKFDMPQYGGTSFASLKINSSGRFKIYNLDLYGREEELR